MYTDLIEPFPTRIALELTPRCNLSCPMCPRHHIQVENIHMSNMLFRKLITEIKAENSQAIILPFWRGESCLHPEFLELIGFALDEGMRLHLSTNGHFMDQYYMSIFYRCEFVTFSLHTDKGFFNAQKLIQKKPLWSATTIQGSFVETEKSAGKFLKQCTRDPNLQGFDSIRLYAEHTIDGKFGKSAATQDRRDRSFCPKLCNTLIVSADGSFSRCNHVWVTEPSPSLNAVDITDIWKSKRLSMIRSGYPDVHCAPCDQWSGHTNGQVWKKDAQGRMVHINYGQM